ncbi:MAG: Jag N-terminal domain-containing protein [Candidatus Omnitrophica bacterium]|nr:Jag N-terminal domain-containing protein [Candidatus Omnitrophota bacterium]MBU1933262.1 Jag N-terminal domain-containing protein [Candidatus Omnitrophota bacterium]
MKNKNIKQKTDTIEVEAKTATEAIKIALETLGLNRSDVDVKVCREENKGLFSMHGSKLAKVKVTKKLQKQ